MVMWGGCHGARARQAVADQIRPPLLVLHTVLEPFGADLDHNIEVAHVQR